ncbi:MAG: hypothetical protein ABI410_14590 [Rhodoferax sp.]
MAAGSASQQPSAAGGDALAVVEAKINPLRAELHAWQALSVTTDGAF